MPVVLATAGMVLVESSSSSLTATYDPQAVEERIKQQIDVLAEAEHIGWMEQKYRNGWRYDEIRDDARKLHDCLTLYGELREDQKQKDRNQVGHYPEAA